MATALAQRTAYVALPDQEKREQFKREVEIAYKSGLLPKTVNSPAAAMTIALAGQSMGLDPLSAFRGIDLVEGRIEMRAWLQLAQAKKMIPGFKYKVVESNDTTCQIWFSTPHLDEPHVEVYDMERARTAGLADKKNFQRHPTEMLRNRCISNGLNLCCPEVSFNVYTPEEVNAFEEEMEPKKVDATITDEEVDHEVSDDFDEMLGDPPTGPEGKLDAPVAETLDTYVGKLRDCKSLKALQALAPEVMKWHWSDEQAVMLKEVYEERLLQLSSRLKKKNPSLLEG